MGNFGRAAYDPIFYPHHSNIDRIWCLWTHIPDGARSYPQDAIFNNSQFTFYDENANPVKMNVSQVLDSDLLRYEYEALATQWVTAGVASGKENTIPLCNSLSRSAVDSLIRATPEFSSKAVLTETTPLTFRMTRPPKSSKGTEVLEMSGMAIPNNTAQVHWKAYLFFPEVNVSTTAICPEYAGTFNYIPHMGQATTNPKRTWRVAVGPKLKQIGKDYVESIVITLIQTTMPPGQNVTFTKAKIVYELSPAVTD